MHGHWRRAMCVWTSTLILVAMAIQIQYTVASSPIPLTANLSVARAQLAGTAVKDFVLFAGGYSDAPDSDSDVVDMYHAPSGSWSTSKLSEGRGVICAVSINTPNAALAFFAGGKHENKLANITNRISAVDVFNVSSNRWSLHHLSVARSMVACASSLASGNVYFAGGEYDENRSNPSAQECSDVIDVYNTHTGEWNTMKLSQPRKKLAVASVGSKVVFAGGYLSGVGSVTTVEILDETTMMWTYAKLSTPRFRLQAVGLATRAMFISGQGCDWTCKTADVYDVATNQWSISNMTGGRYEFSAVVVGKAVFVAGGKMPRQGFAGVVDSFDVSTSTWSNKTATALAIPRFFLAGASVPGTPYAMFAGGDSLDPTNPGLLSSVEVVRSLM